MVHALGLKLGKFEHVSPQAYTPFGESQSVKGIFAALSGPNGQFVQLVNAQLEFPKIITLRGLVF